MNFEYNVELNFTQSLSHHTKTVTMVAVLQNDYMYVKLLTVKCKRTVQQFR